MTDGLVERVRAGDPRAIARAMTLVERDAPEGVALARDLYPHTGRAWLVGVTGPPGVGKSTLVDAITRRWRADGRSVGVVAVDPSSPFTGGAILGDRIRMQSHAGDDGVFIRSMATRGQLGGLARATGDVVSVLDAAGKDVVLIETVGVGQDEVDIVGTADVSIVVLVPQTGDGVQALKAGVLEIADLLVVNKADLDGADRLAATLEATLALRTHSGGAWRPPVLLTEATGGRGLEELLAALQRHRACDGGNDLARRRMRAETALRAILTQRCLQRISTEAFEGQTRERLLDAIAARTIDPHSAADRLMAEAFGPARRESGEGVEG